MDHTYILDVLRREIDRLDGLRKSWENQRASTRDELRRLDLEINRATHRMKDLSDLIEELGEK